MTQQIQKGWKRVKLSAVLDYEQPTEYIVYSEILEEETPVPVLTANKGFIKGYTKEKEGICKNLPVIIFDDFTTDTKFVNFPFKVKSSAMKILKLKDKDALLKYIFYQMQTFNVRATTHKRYYLSEYQNLDFLFPIDLNQKISLEKQSLIVSEIEKQFTRLDESVKSLQAVKQKLEVYRKAVLKKAFEKKKGWEERPMKNLVEDISSGYACGRHEKSGEGLIHFRPYNITPEGNISYDEIKIVDPNYSNKRLEYGDIIFNNTNSQIWVGKTCAYTSQEKVGFSNHMTRIRTNNNLIDFKFLAKYLHYLFLRGFYYTIMKSHVNQSSVNIDRLQEISIPFPKSLQEQQQIVSSIEDKFSVIDKLEQIVEASLNKAEKLRKSILKGAFEGKLVKMGGNSNE